MRIHRLFYAALPIAALALLSACQPASGPASAAPTAAAGAEITAEAQGTSAAETNTVPPATTEAAAGSTPTTAAPTRIEPTKPPEAEIVPIPISGPLAMTEAEISGMTWWGDTLVLLPQFPARMADRPGGALFTLTKQEILDFLDGKTSGPLEPRPLPLESGGLEKLITGFEGFEAIAFHERSAYLTIEASPGGKMKSYLVRGEIAEDGSVLRLEADRFVDVPLDMQFINYSNEAIVIDGERVLLFYEANGAAAYPQAQTRAYTLDLQETDSQPLPALEYRLTDATQPDAQGRFWVTNIFTPIDFFIYTTRDPLAEQYGQGATHTNAAVVERLVQMQLGPDGQISLAAQPPLQIQLAEGQVPRNWEGLVRLEARGFLLATDKFPQTILAFAPGQP